MAARFEVEHKGKDGALDAFAKRLRLGREAKNTSLTVGVHENEAHRTDGDGITNAQLAELHEFGSRDGHTPARPVIRSTLAANRRLYQELGAKLFKRYLNGHEESVESALAKLGIRIVRDMKVYARKNLLPLAASTIASKRRHGMPRPNAPLFGTGAYMESIKAKFEGTNTDVGSVESGE